LSSPAFTVAILAMAWRRVELLKRLSDATAVALHPKFCMADSCPNPNWETLCPGEMQNLSKRLLENGWVKLPFASILNLS